MMAGRIRAPLSPKAHTMVFHVLVNAGCALCAASIAAFMAGPARRPLLIRATQDQAGTRRFRRRF
jgi:hypothetical protein